MKNLTDLPVQVMASQSRIFQAGEVGIIWRVVEGVVRLDRESGQQRLPVQLALPGDLIGVEVLCGQPYQFTATAFSDCQLVPIRVRDEAHCQALLQEVLLQQQDRSQDMATLRTGSVVHRLSHLLRLLGLPWQGLSPRLDVHADRIRQQLPALRDLAMVVDAKHETVCRALSQLLPPRSRKSGPVAGSDPSRRASTLAWASAQGAAAPMPS
ncbi:MAG: cyclic nucleotide-binding domain-containing protein [Burkholderiaceae bacterium]